MKAIDRKYLSRAIGAFNKAVRIRNEEKRYDEALHLASFHLNPLGMEQFDVCIRELIKRRDCLDLIFDDEVGHNPNVVGISEKYKNVPDPVKYNTTADVCYCKRYFKKGICLHILFIREYYDLPAFETNLFMRFRYLKNVALHDRNDDEEMGIDEGPEMGIDEGPRNEPNNADIYSTDDQPNKRKDLRPQDRYLKVMEVTKEICDVATKYEPSRFNVVLEALEAMEKIIRTNGVDTQLLTYLKNPSDFELVPHQRQVLLSDAESNLQQGGVGQQQCEDPQQQQGMPIGIGQQDENHQHHADNNQQHHGDSHHQHGNDQLHHEDDPYRDDNHQQHGDTVHQQHGSHDQHDEHVQQDTQDTDMNNSNAAPHDINNLRDSGEAAIHSLQGTSSIPYSRRSLPQPTFLMRDTDQTRLPRNVATPNPDTPGRPSGTPVQATNTPSTPRQNPRRAWPQSPFPDTPGLTSRVRQPPVRQPPVVVQHFQRIKHNLIYPSNLVDTFKAGSSQNSARNIETLATLAGYFSKERNSWIVSDIIYPIQTGSSTFCSETPGNYYANHLIQNKLTQLGTIHTHPRFSSFLSSVDLHMHAQIQRYENSAIAIVYSPMYDTAPAYTLNDIGLGVIMSCRAPNQDAGHLHSQPDDTLYQVAQHTSTDPSLPLNVMDCREGPQDQQDGQQSDGNHANNHNASMAPQDDRAPQNASDLSPDHPSDDSLPDLELARGVPLPPGSVGGELI